jgi:hypothetical protein
MNIFCVKKFCIVVSFLMMAGICQSQNNTKIIPPSPNAASLGKFVDMPVGYYSGIPQISVPIYEIKSGNFTLPISIDYHAGGIKVEEVASSVGLGWALNAGGVVTRVIRGYADDCNIGYLNFNGSIYGPILSTYNQSNTNEFGKLRAYERGEQDTEPDLFYFNFNGVAGSFCFNETGEIIQQPFQKIKIERMGNGYSIFGFNIITEDGTKYIFTEKEAVTSYTVCSGLGGNSSGPGECNSFDLASSWYLKQIILPKTNVINDAINFDYNLNDSYNNNYSYTFQNAYSPTETSYLEAYTGSVLVYMSFECRRQKTVCHLTTQTLGKRLSKITFKGGKVLFVPGFERADLVGDKVLEKIIVLDDNHIPQHQ